MKIKRVSPITGKINVMDLDVVTEQIVRWEKGELIQDVFPKLTADEREFIKTGITPEDWNEMFGEAND